VSTKKSSTPERHTKSIGQHAEAVIIAKLLEVGYKVLVPYLGENLRYDLVIEDEEGKFWRVQCKSGKLYKSQEYIEFNASSSYYHHSQESTTWGRRSYQGQIEYFAVYCLDTKSTYLVPVDHVPSTEGRLRLLPTRNGQEKNIRWAKDYEI
jgi:hypothetical protein